MHSKLFSLMAVTASLYVDRGYATGRSFSSGCRSTISQVERKRRKRLKKLAEASKRKNRR